MKEETLLWLLEAETPTIRYLALVDLMGQPEEDGRVQEARQAIMRRGPVPAILADSPCSTRRTCSLYCALLMS